MNDEILGYAVVIAVIIVPALGITARLAIKPIVDAIVRLKDTFDAVPASGAVERRVMELEEELREVRVQLGRMRDRESFDQALSNAGTAEAQVHLSSGSEPRRSQTPAAGELGQT